MEQLLVDTLLALAAKHPWAIVAYNLLPPIWVIIKIIVGLTKTKKDDLIVKTIDSKLIGLKKKK